MKDQRRKMTNSRMKIVKQQKRVKERKNERI